MKNWFYDASRRRLRALWRILIGYFLMLLILGILAATVDAIEVPWIESFTWQLIAAPLLILLARFLARRVDRREFSEYGLTRSSNWASHLAIGIVGGATLPTVVFLVGLATGAIEVRGYAQTTYSVPWIVTFVVFALRYASVGLFEELIHRGFLITNITDGLRAIAGRHVAVVALIVSSLVFGLLHMTNDHATWLAALNIFLVGLMLGLPYVRTGSLYASIGLHFAWNFFLGNVYGLPVSGYTSRSSLIQTDAVDSVLWTGGDFGPEGSVIVTILTIIGILVTLRLTRTGELS